MVGETTSNFGRFCHVVRPRRIDADKLHKPLAWGVEDDTRRVFFNFNGVIWCLVDGTDIVLAGSLLAAMMVLDLLLCGLCGRRVAWYIVVGGGAVGVTHEMTHDLPLARRTVSNNSSSIY